MKETLEVRIAYEYAHLLFSEEEGRSVGSSVKIVDISPDDPRYSRSKKLIRKLRDGMERPFTTVGRLKENTAAMRFRPRAYFDCQLRLYLNRRVKSAARNMTIRKRVSYAEPIANK